MQLAILLAVVCALAQGEALPGARVGDTWLRAAFTLLGVFAAPLATLAGARRLALAIEQLPGHQLEASWARLNRSSLFVWLTAVAATVYIIQWPQVVRTDWGFADWPLVDEILILVPVVLPLLLVWGAKYQVEWRCQCITSRNGTRALLWSAAPPTATPVAAPPWRPFRFVWLKAWQFLGPILAPALVVIGLQEILAAPSVEPRLGGRASWMMVPFLGTMLILLPVALRRLWRTNPLPSGPLRERLLQICREQKIGIREILLWHTHDRNANAAVAGLVPGLRYIFLTDGLLARLSDEEAAAVLRHELGHIAGRHLMLRMLLLGLPVAMYLGLNAAFPAVCEQLAAVLTSAGIGPPLQTSLLVPAGLLAFAVLVVGRYSQWLEHEADLAACRGVGGSMDQSATECFVRALAKVVGRGRESRLANWLHPSLEQRVAFLKSAAADPRIAEHFCRRLRWTGWALVACYGAIVLAMAVL